MSKLDEEHKKQDKAVKIQGILFSSLFGLQVISNILFALFLATATVSIMFFGFLAGACLVLAFWSFIDFKKLRKQLKADHEDLKEILDKIG